MKEVNSLLEEETDENGDLKNTGEARALYHMKQGLSTEISRDATKFLKLHGFDGGGNKPAKKEGKK